MMLSSPRFSSLRLAAAIVCLPLSGGITRADEPHPAATAVVSPLGATPPQIAALYGPVLRHNARVRHHQILEGGTVIDGDLYSRNGLVIRAVFYAGAAVLLEYTRATGPLTMRDVNVLLAANAGAAGTWEPGKDSTEINRYYRRSDGKALAHYTSEYDGSLLIAAENTGTDFYGGKLMSDH